jgi:transcriptional regulator with XRE-family HTH domain
MVSRWESGKSSPVPASLLNIAAATRVNMLWLAYGQGPMEVNSAPAQTGVSADA